MVISKQGSTAVAEQEETLVFRVPTEDDGKAIWKLIKETGVLDLNSSYSYLMWAKFFDQTSVVVETNEQIVGFISGFIQPNTPDTLFIWQVAVDETQRQKGLASRMLQAILHRYACRNIRYLEATVGTSNEASEALFQKLSRDLKTAYHVTEFFTEDQFPGKGHEDERLFKIGPFQQV
ncbi:diaminobutyrate acetyltransferase [Sporosarcina pasteurii]|uniref:L-2,4-diaminobutyric acid acetyltransferase n=1 Tax=Sporosarcina pasteurii TaxID=1474 RepID=A0A380C0L1_SPOPA|nr:diaminobutyrate acetyltransferase [Sporosarcina pasteurii]MDS9471493.1 diaminobutyrate acetyltransferase [Sporosarcina pasteurii]SUJ10552.1 L-2,4-diaminobutyric acid acetyltransferase [Sporosarcina pasteurii]